MAEKMKIIAITKPPKYFFRIGESFNYSTWYNFEKIKDSEEIKKIKIGDFVEISSEKEEGGKEPVLTSVKLLEVAKVQNTGSSGEQSFSNHNNGQQGTDWNKVNEGIRKQAVGKMVARSLMSMNLEQQGIVDVISLIKELFKTYDELTR